MAGAVLGIHSNVAYGAKTGGHAWISITENSATTTYGLWPDSHRLTVDNGAESDVRVGMENNGDAVASRYYQLTSDQTNALRVAILRNATWRYTNNCSSWASELVYDIVKEDVNADDMGLLGIETPRQLGMSILRMELRQPTSILAPASASDAKPGSSSYHTSSMG